MKKKTNSKRHAVRDSKGRFTKKKPVKKKVVKKSKKPLKKKVVKKAKK